MLRCLGLMTLGLLAAGCAKDPLPEKLVMVPVVVETTPIRCVDVTTVEFTKTTPRPKPPLDKDATRAWIDKLETSEYRKNAAGQSLAKDYAACKGQSPAAKAKATS
jgi:hypothetical protein